MLFNPRVPKTCPDGFKGRYTVSPGDTLYMLAGMFRVRLDTLAEVNPHIPNPNVLYPGDILCVPSLVRLPCCTELIKQIRVPFGSYATAFFAYAPRGGQSVTVTATLPEPSYFGRYDIYIATVFFKETGGFGNELFPSPEDPPTWSSRIELPTALSIVPDSIVTVQPFNSQTGETGPVIFSNSYNCN